MFKPYALSLSTYQLIFARISCRQMITVLVIALLLFPIAIPVPASAFVDRSPTKVEGSIGNLQQRPGFEELSDATLGFISGISAFSRSFTNVETNRGADIEHRFDPAETAEGIRSIDVRANALDRLRVGEQALMFAVALDSNGNAVNGISPKWTSDDDTIVTFDGDKAIAKKVGETVVSVSAGSVTERREVKVENNVSDRPSQHSMPVRTTPHRNSAGALLLDTPEDVVRDSTYTPENNVGSPPNSKELESPNAAVVGRIKHRAGAANYSFDIPFASLPGRGIDATVGMTYNSRVWNTSGNGSSGDFQFNVDKNWLAPGFTVGYGKLSSHWWSKQVWTSSGLKNYNYIVPEGFTDPDGTRHQIECKATAIIPQSTQGDTYCSEYGTIDGSFVKVDYHGTPNFSDYNTIDYSTYATTYFTLTHSDGTRVTYSYPGAQFASDDFYRDHYPVSIQDRNGNTIQIAYKDGKDNIEYIKDTLGRYIKFYYDPSADRKLVAVTVPGLDGAQEERQVARFYYDDSVTLSYQGRLSGSVTAPSTYRALRYVYFPGTGQGYRYDYHPNFGMITKITKLMGMTVSGSSLTATGTVTSSDGPTTAATTEYLFPNDGSQAPLTDVPKYTQRTDNWTSTGAVNSAVTEYDSPEPATGNDRTSTIIVHDTDFDVEYKTTSFNTTDWQNGLTKETSITKRFGPTGQYSTLMAKSSYSWIQSPADATGRQYPLIDKIEFTNDAGQTWANSFGYDNYTNQTVIREHDFASAGTLGAELRRTEIDYQTGSAWINNHLFRLPVEIRTIAGGVAVSKTHYDYDDYSQFPLAGTPGVIQYNDPGTSYRGNVTKITSFSNAALSSDPNASVHTKAYDVTGNVVQASMSCCNMKSIEYSSAYQYAYPTKITKGSGTTQLVTQATYDYNTGLTTQTQDENGGLTNYHFDPSNLRQTLVSRPDGSTTSTEYNDSSYPYFVKTTSSLDASRTVSDWNFFDGAGRSFRSRSVTANGYLSNDVEYDSLGRQIRSYNPYTVANLTDERPTSGVPFTQVTKIDALGRTLETTLQDNTKITAEYSGVTTTITDQANKQRRQVTDALGRIVHVDEPNSSGDLGSVNVPAQPTIYEYDGNDNLTKVTQAIPGVVTQERIFQYDSLSRLTKEKQVEANATLNDSGVKVSSGGLWTGVYKYNPDGLLTEAFDARGVKTTLGYDGLNRLWTVSYSGETGYQTPPVTYVYDEARSDSNGQAYSNTGRLTTVKTDPVTNTATGQATPATFQYYNYHKAGQIVDHTQTLGTDTYNLKYGYNLAGQLTSETYPSGRVVSTTIDNYGVPQTVADATRTYISGVSLSGRGLVSQINLGNGTSETFSFNDRLQMQGQSLLRGSDVLQKYDYSYGKADLTTGSVDSTKNNGQIGKIEGTIGANKQWSQVFGYDELGRLKEAREYKQGDTSHLTYKQVFDFDRFGNLYRKAASNPTFGQENPLTFTAIEDSDINKAKNQLTTGITYNDAGQIISDSKFNDMGFAYDANGRQIKATRANTPDALTVYDALGNRVATKVNDAWRYMIYDAFGQLVAEYGASSTEGTGGAKFVQQDSQGSVRTITNSNGFVVARTDHQAFGAEIGVGTGTRSIEQGYSADKVTRQGYGLTENDEATGEQHAWARQLEPIAGRWTTPDPYNGSISINSPQSINRYRYGDNDPINSVDPSGLMPQLYCSSVNYPGEPHGPETCDSMVSWYLFVLDSNWGGYSSRKDVPTVDAIVRNVEKIVKDAPSECQDLFAKNDALKKLKDMEKDKKIAIDGDVKIYSQDFHLEWREVPLSETSFGGFTDIKKQRIYLNPNSGLIKAVFSEKDKAEYESRGMSPLDVASSVLMHELLHATKVFPPDLKSDSNRNMDTSLSRQHQRELLDKCFPKKS